MSVHDRRDRVPPSVLDTAVKWLTASGLEACGTRFCRELLSGIAVLTLHLTVVDRGSCSVSGKSAQLPDAEKSPKRRRLAKA